MAGAAAVVTLGLASTAACVDSGERALPEPPDMIPLLSAYEEPSAELTQEVADAMIPVVRDRLRPARQMEYLAFLEAEVIEPAVAQAEGDDPSEPPFGFAARGYARIEHICRGDGQDPDLERDGYLEMMLTFRESGVDPVFWGEAFGCRQVIANRELVIEGRVRAHRDESMLFWLDARVEIERELALSGQLDFRATRDWVELLVPVAGDAHLVYVVELDRGVSVRALNGTFVCDASGACENEDGDRVTFVELP